MSSGESGCGPAGRALLRAGRHRQEEGHQIPGEAGESGIPHAAAAADCQGQRGLCEAGRHASL